PSLTLKASLPPTCPVAWQTLQPLAIASSPTSQRLRGLFLLSSPKTILLATGPSRLSCQRASMEGGPERQRALHQPTVGQRFVRTGLPARQRHYVGWTLPQSG